MTPVHAVAGELHLEEAALTEIASRFGTPTYVYSRRSIESAFRAYQQAFGAHPHLVCYAMKANSNLAILNLLARLGAGFDIVSGGELARVLAAGGRADRTIFSGVGKTHEEIRAALEAGILCFNIESEPELLRINTIAGELGKTAAISVRVNPDVDAKTHPYISTGLKQNKFGIPHTRVVDVYRRAASLPHVRVAGIDSHIGSQLLDAAPLSEAMARVLSLVDQLEREGIAIEHIDNGGGVGIPYTADERAADITSYVHSLVAALGSRNKTLLLEPGRSIVGNAGLLLTRVEYLKRGDERDFCIVDGSMSELLRPMLYEAYHEMVAVRPHGEARAYDIVGPVCESTDVLGKNRMLAVREGDLLAVLSAGAYGMVMASNYNSRPRPAEVLVDGTHLHLTRSRDTIASMYENEQIPLL